jgi:hypothetical protein
MSILSKISVLFCRKPKPHPEAGAEPIVVNSASERSVERGTYISDAPVDEPSDDKFDRQSFANRIAETVGAKIDPSSIVIGVYGPWGGGKTTVLNFVAKALGNYESVICFKFNPWRFEDEAVLLRAFFASLAGALNRRLSKRKEELGKVLQKYSSVAASTVKAAKSTLELTGTPVPGEPVGDLADAVANLGAVWSATSLDELHDRIDAILKAEKKRVVVLMDDIDRLDKSEIHAILRLVKLTADFKYTAYILAFDHEMVAAAIGERYSGNPSGTLGAGRSFLEKIIQVPLNLPPVPESALVSFGYECINQALAESRVQLTTDEEQMFTTHFQSLAESMLKTPRIAKRYANALAFSLSLLKGEAHLGELMLVEAMRLFYPQLYVQVRNNRDLMLGAGHYAWGILSREDVKKEIAAAVEEGTKGLNDNAKECARSLLNTLFPRTGDSNYGSEWDNKWAAEKKISSASYFDRYFSYAIAATDVSDLKVDNFLVAAPALDRDEALRQFRSLLTAANAGAVIAKLRQVETAISSEQAVILVAVIGAIADSLPNPNPTILGGFTTPFAQAAIFVAHLLRRIPDETQRREVASSVLAGSPLRFACEIMRWSVAGEKGEEGVFASATETNLKQQVATRITGYITNNVEPIYLTEPEQALTYLQFAAWFGGREEVRKYLTGALIRRPESVVDFLRVTSPTAWDMATGMPIETALRREQYNLIAKLVEPTVIADILHNRFGSALETPKSSTNRQRNTDEELARQFMAIHRAVLQEQGKKTAGLEQPGETDMDSGKST